MVSASIDATGNYVENIRDGLSWKLFEENSETLLRNKNINCLLFLPTINLLSIPKHKELLEWIVELVKKTKASNDKWYISENFVNFPIALHPGILPETFKKYIQEAIDFLNQEYPNHPHVKWLLIIKEMIGTIRNKDNILKARQFFIDQGLLKNKDYFKIFPMLDEIL